MSNVTPPLPEAGHWHRAQALSPRLRDHIRAHVIEYRGQPWCVLEDRLNGRYHRFDQRAGRVIGRLDGHRSLHEVWHGLLAEDEEAPSQDELLQLLGQLHALDLLGSDGLPDLDEQARRRRVQAAQRRWQRYMNPLSMRWSLVDPDRFLDRLTRGLSPGLGRNAALLWIAWVAPAFGLALLHWTELSRNFVERSLALDSLLLMGLIYPLLKLLHEIGHGVACKLRGGAVHEMGLMFLLFVPVPYVDTSSAWVFARRRDRVLVGAAGITVELVIGAAAFYLWLWMEPGLAKAIAYDVAVLASVGTVILNANPLMRYDGYFILADALAIPNLAQRSTRYWGWLFERIVLQRASTSPVRAAGEAPWFVAYAPLSFAYRLVVTSSIALYVSVRYPTVGTFIAIWSVGANIGLPLWRGTVALRNMLGESRVPGLHWRLSAAALALVAVLAVPLPHHTQAEGVLWLPDRALLRAPQAGFIVGVHDADASWVEAGQRVVTLADPALAAHAQQLQAREEGARARYQATLLIDPVRAEPLRSALVSQMAQNRDALDRVAALNVRTQTAGRLSLSAGDDLLGRRVRQGEILGYVIPDQAPLARVVVDQSEAEFVRDDARHVELRLAAEPGRSWSARIVRALPSASNDLPSAALGRSSGGDSPTDPRAGDGRRSLLSHFEYELALPAAFPYRFVGSRVSVRFEHRWRPLAWRLWHGLRVLFLSEFKA
ncbi:hypothetical protein [Roseateles saccharophilus]|uniref:Putative peptide zinc metalloprotease protein n=1 Tax=Roseateles saccharophilus TaxID=304 RepID=A0A4R3ULH4_ROSSA|nr:hypothetical protein [Roseateles saccharophilus]MDG0833523.1 hypothetical protein [Roseateles saccharophilus]TCU92546.1 putative peptide zinc metalloprotease protein [Roseateles saccharophilus]